MSGQEASLGFAWLSSVLSADSQLAGYAPGGCWRAYAPPGTATPFVVLALQTGGDTVTMNGFRVMSQALYQVKAVGPAGVGLSGVTNAAQRLDVLLGGTTAGPAAGDVVISSVTVGRVLSCYRQSPLSIDELVNGEPWTNIGGLYRLQIVQV